MFCKKRFFPFSRTSCHLFQSAAILYLKAVTNNHLHSIDVFTLSFIYLKMFIMYLHYTLQVTHFKRGKISFGSFLESPKYNHLRNVVFSPYPDLLFFLSWLVAAFISKLHVTLFISSQSIRKVMGWKKKKKTLRLCLFVFAQPQFYFLKSDKRAAAGKEKSFEILIFFG